MKPLRFGFLLVLAALLLSGYAGRENIHLSEAWVRPTPPGAPSAAVYVLIENGTGEADRLLSVSSEAAEAAEIHSMTLQDGMMVMRPVKGGLPVPAHGALHFKPGGYHIMLIGPKRQIKPGDSISVTLTFAKAGQITLNVQAKEMGGGMAVHAHEKAAGGKKR